MKTKFLPVFLLIISIFVLPIFSAQVKYAGARQSCYGADNGGSFPTEEEWGNIMLNMTDFFPGSIPVGLWIVGTIYQNACMLEFPTPGGSFNKIEFEKTDWHEKYLNYFDQIGVKALLQVESGDADMEQLIDLVLNQYGHHRSVIGFGVDGEWYFSSQASGGLKISDEAAETWEEKVKSHKSSYKLFLKHYKSSNMPPNYRGEIIFADDGQIWDDLSEMVKAFTNWADIFSPNEVIFQVGYSNDYKWWQQYSHPPQAIGNALAEGITNNDQNIGITWVDFTLRYEEIEPLLFKDHPTTIEYDNVITLVKNTDNITVVRDVFNPFISIQYNLTGGNDNAALFIITTNGTVINSYILNSNSGKILWNTNDYASGAYLINVKNGNSVLTQKMFLAK